MLVLWVAPYSLFFILYSLLFTPCSLLLVPYSLFLVLYSLFLVPCSLFFIPYSSLSPLFLIPPYPPYSLFLLIPLIPPYSSLFLLLPSSYLLSVKPPYNSDMKRVSCSENVNFVR